MNMFFQTSLKFLNIFITLRLLRLQYSVASSSLKAVKNHHHDAESGMSKLRRIIPGNKHWKKHTYHQGICEQ